MKAHDAVQLVELSQRRRAVPTFEVSLGQGEVGGLVGRFSDEDLVPVLRLVQQLGVQAAQVQPGLLGPRFVEVLRQQLASVQRERRLRRGDAAVCNRGRGMPLKSDDVDVRAVIGVQRHRFGAEDQGVAVAQGPAGVVRSLVQAGGRKVDA